MKAAGIIEGTRGPSGGYRWRSESDGLSLAEIFGFWTQRVPNWIVPSGSATTVSRARTVCCHSSQRPVGTRPGPNGGCGRQMLSGSRCRPAGRTSSRVYGLSRSAPVLYASERRSTVWASNSVANEFRIGAQPSCIGQGFLLPHPGNPRMHCVKISGPSMASTNCLTVISEAGRDNLMPPVGPR
ncbi:MAG: hypothetical protein ACI80V_002296 [Rhodothermales bacterium]|jgi:hypothetical protein